MFCQKQKEKVWLNPYLSATSVTKTQILFIMIIRSKDKVKVNDKNKPV